MSGQFHTTYGLNKNYLLSKVGQDVVDITSVDGYTAEMFFVGLESIVTLLLMIPLIIITEMFNAMGLLFGLFAGTDTDWYVNEKQWYEFLLEKENAKFNHTFGNAFENLENEVANELETLKLPRMDDWWSMQHTVEYTFEWLARMFK